MAYLTRYGTGGYLPGSLFDELDLMRRRMDQLFGIYQEPSGRGWKSNVFPAINITESSDKYFVRAELPGISQQGLDIQAAGSGLSISGERKIPAREGAKYHRKEREEGKFSRAVNLPGEINAEGIEAQIRDGMLTIAIPKVEKAKPRQITVK